MFGMNELPLLKRGKSRSSNSNRENRTGEKGKGGMASGNPGPSRKGSPYISQRSFYRWHIMDPIRFEEDIKVTIQQIGVYHGRLFECEDDVASVAYWYQAEPHAVFEPLMERKSRWPR